MPLLYKYTTKKQEHFIAIPLNGAHEVIAVKVVTIGLVNRSMVHPREVFRYAIQKNAAAVIIAHNHPSGNVEPSDEDRVVTDRMREAAKVVGIRLLDHVIVGKRGYYSFLENQRM
jgi:DNA repair protein RadC